MTVVFANGPLKGTVIPQADGATPPLSIYVAQSITKAPLPASPSPLPNPLVTLTAHHYVRNRTDLTTNMAQYIYAGDVQIA